MRAINNYRVNRDYRRLFVSSTPYWYLVPTTRCNLSELLPGEKIAATSYYLSDTMIDCHYKTYWII